MQNPVRGKTLKNRAYPHEPHTSAHVASVPAAWSKGEYRMNWKSIGVLAAILTLVAGCAPKADAPKDVAAF